MDSIGTRRGCDAAELPAAKVKVHAKMKRQNYNVTPSEKQGTRKPYPVFPTINWPD
jgi:hypothetical protein